MTLGELFTSGPAITLYIAVVLFAWNWIKRRQQWDTERWEGMLATAFALAEKSGLQSSNQKLNQAIAIFATKFKDTYNREPDPMDLKDAALDFGRLALEYKFASGGK